MGTQDRKKRQFAEREQVFLDQAWDLITREGVLNLQMAKLAAECEYSVGTLYLHFASKEDLLLALATRTIHRRLELYQQALDWKAPTRSRMLAIYVADILFAKSAPECFRLARYVSTHTIWSAASDPRRETALQASEPLGVIVQGLVDEAVASGELDCHGLSSQQLSAGLWAMDEGTRVLTSAADQLQTQGVPEPYQLLLHHCHALLNGLGWQTLVPLDDRDAQLHLLAQILGEAFNNEPMAGELLASFSNITN